MAKWQPIETAPRDGAHSRGDAAEVIRHWYGQTMDADTQQSYAKITGILLNTSRE